MNINEIKELLLVIDKTNLEYVKLESSELKLEVAKNNNTINTVASTMEAQTTNSEEKEDYVIPSNTTGNNDYVVVTAPLMGTFYQSSSPEADIFVKVGDTVQEGDTLCILEAMKLMNEISSEVRGEIVEILVKNEELVEYNQPLFKIKPL